MNLPKYNPKIDYSKSDLKVSVADNKLNISIKNIITSFDLASVFQRIANASEAEKKQFRVAAAGYEIHWYLIDEDISIPSLSNKARPEYRGEK